MQHLSNLFRSPADCLPHIAAFLEPHELQALRCTNKALRQNITDNMKQTSMENTVVKYRHKVIRTPDGAVRLFTRLGRQTLDMFAIPGRFQGTDIKTPLYVLRQDGMGDQIGGMTSVEFTTPEHSDELQYKRAIILEQGNDAVILTKEEAQIRTIWRECQGTKEYTTFILDIGKYEGSKTIFHLTIKYDFAADFPDKTPVHSRSTQLAPL